ncbi:MAG: hypothetical protein D6719_10540 [Candidatus Dadabacteria bacterium]|nr:MAG: hypothetical protein D6719_10540 [Candidatus Dadabacteria bacterium]
MYLKRISALIVVLFFCTEAAFANSHFSLSFTGRTYDSINNTTTFSYTLCWDETPPSLSHFTVGVCADLSSNSLVSSSPSGASLGQDGSTGIYGVKWDPPR